jgi:hypothetical protein
MQGIRKHKRGSGWTQIALGSPSGRKAGEVAMISTVANQGKACVARGLERIEAQTEAKQVKLCDGFSDESNQILNAALEHLLVKAADGVKLEVL